MSRPTMRAETRAELDPQRWARRRAKLTAWLWGRIAWPLLAVAWLLSFRGLSERGHRTFNGYGWLFALGLDYGIWLAWEAINRITSIIGRVFAWCMFLAAVGASLAFQAHRGDPASFVPPILLVFGVITARFLRTAVERAGLTAPAATPDAEQTDQRTDDATTSVFAGVDTQLAATGGLDGQVPLGSTAELAPARLAEPGSTMANAAGQDAGRPAGALASVALDGPNYVASAVNRVAPAAATGDVPSRLVDGGRAGPTRPRGRSEPTADDRAVVAASLAAGQITGRSDAQRSMVVALTGRTDPAGIGLTAVAARKLLAELRAVGNGHEQVHELAVVVADAD